MEKLRHLLCNLMSRKYIYMNLEPCKVKVLESSGQQTINCADYCGETGTGNGIQRAGNNMLSSSCSQPSYINTGFFSYFSFMQKTAHNINDLDDHP